jgi:hypothetical protein
MTVVVCAPYDAFTLHACSCWEESCKCVGPPQQLAICCADPPRPAAAHTDAHSGAAAAQQELLRSVTRAAAIAACCTRVRTHSLCHKVGRHARWHAHDRYVPTCSWRRAPLARDQHAIRVHLKLAAPWGTDDGVDRADGAAHLYRPAPWHLTVAGNIYSTHCETRLSCEHMQQLALCPTAFGRIKHPLPEDKHFKEPAGCAAVQTAATLKTACARNGQEAVQRTRHASA